MLDAAREWISLADLARAIGRRPKDGTVRRLRDDLLRTEQLEQRETDGHVRRVPPVGHPWERGTVAPGTPLGGEITDAERRGLLLAQQELVDTGIAEWVHDGHAEEA